MALTNDPWNGPERIVLGIDIGTVYSAVAYSYLYKGGPRSITSVSEWPDQAKVSEPRVPTLLWYDKGTPIKCGASALIPNPTQAKEKGWQLAKLFKLNMHPETMKLEHQFETPDLPDGVPLSQIYSDYMTYLLSHTRQFFEAHVLEGGTLWNKLFESAYIVITHPNGWGLSEQHFLRKAAIVAGFPDPQKTRSRIRFLTDAEACVHFCVLNGRFGSDWLKRGVQFAICDAGGSTVDITTYEVTRTDPSLFLKETRASASVPAGAIFVARAAQKDLNNPDKTAYAEFGEPDIEPHGINKSDLIQNAHRIIQTILPLLAKVLRILEQIMGILENAARVENQLALEVTGTSLKYEVTEESVPSEGEISFSSPFRDEDQPVNVKNEFSLEGAGGTPNGDITKDSSLIEGVPMSLSGDKEKVVSVKNEFPLEAARSPFKGEPPKDFPPIDEAISTFPLNGNEEPASRIENSLAPGGTDSPPKSEMTEEVVPIKGVIDTAASFDPYVDMIVAALKKQTAGSEIKRIFLVGSFGKSQYLCRKLIAEMAKENRQITVVDDLTAKPTTVGAVTCAAEKIDRVEGRALRPSYGTDIGPIFDPQDKEHQGRKIHRWADGHDHIHHEWSEVAARDQIIKTNESVSKPYVRYYKTGAPKLSSFSVALYAFTTPDPKAPRFMRDPDRRFLGLTSLHLPGLRKGFRKECDLSADLSGMSGGLERQLGPDGAFWVLSFSIGILLRGDEEVQAYVEWEEKGAKKQGGITILTGEDMGSESHMQA